MTLIVSSGPSGSATFAKQGSLSERSVNSLMPKAITAAQNEPASLVYGAIIFLLLVGVALLISASKWEKLVTGHKDANHRIDR
jgi:hypothetical protein